MDLASGCRSCCWRINSPERFTDHGETMKRLLILYAGAYPGYSRPVACIIIIIVASYCLYFSQKFTLAAVWLNDYHVCHGVAYVQISAGNTGRVLSYEDIKQTCFIGKHSFSLRALPWGAPVRAKLTLDNTNILWHDHIIIQLFDAMPMGVNAPMPNDTI